MPMPPLMRRDARSALHAALFVVGVVVFVIIAGCANSQDTGFLPGMGTTQVPFPPAPGGVSLNGSGSGANGGGGGGGGGNGQGTLYVGTVSGHNILLFNASDNGNAAPRATLTVPSRPGLVA